MKYEKIVFNRMPMSKDIIMYMDENNLFDKRFLYRIFKGDNKKDTMRFIRTGTDVVQPKNFLDYDERDYIKLVDEIRLDSVISKVLNKLNNENKSLFVGVYKRKFLELVGGEEYCFGDGISHEDRLNSLEKLLRFSWERVKK